MKTFHFDHKKIKKLTDKHNKRVALNFSKTQIDFKPQINKTQKFKLKLDSEIGIYKIECKVTKSIYIGQSKNIPARIKHHKTALNSILYKDRYPNMQGDFYEYGEENFIFEAIHNCDDYELLMWETTYIEHYLNEGFTVYNHILDTTDANLVNCPGKFTDIIKRLVKQLEIGKITPTDLEKALYYAENY
jgi:group I intron endonuclease